MAEETTRSMARTYGRAPAPGLLSTAARCGLLVAVVAAAGLGAGAAVAQGGQDYVVKITNLTRGQIFSPPIVVTHHADVQIFEAGSPASDELAALAEDGDNGPLADLLGDLEQVFDVTTASGPVLPGQTITLEVSALSPYNRISVAGMLVTTNDAFFALNSGSRPNGRAAETWRVPAYDAGSEENNELCAFVPGPPCGNGGVRAPAGAEGYVHIHAGIHGDGDIGVAGYDWRNPVASITVQRR